MRPRPILALAIIIALAAGCVAVEPPAATPALGVPTAQPSTPTAAPTSTPTTAPSAQPTASAVLTPTPSPIPTPAKTTPPTAEPTPTPTPTPEPTPTAAPGGTGLVVEWSGGSAAGLGRATGFYDIVQANGVLLAIGDSGDNYETTAWRSTDGRQWQSGRVGGDLTLLNAVTAGGPGFVAVGWEYPSGYITTSADGKTWQPVNDPRFEDHMFSWVGSAGDGLVVFDDSGGVFISADGQDWQPSDDASALEVADGLRDLVGNGSALWAFSTGDGGLVELWRSDDALSWTRVAAIEGSNGSEAVWSAVGPLGFVAIELKSGLRSQMRAWYSPDGSTWTAAENSPTEVDDIIAVAAGYVTVGHYNTGKGCALIETDDVGTTWTSADGLTWRQMPEDGWNGREVQAVAALGSTLIGLGVDWNESYDGNGDSGLLWTADLPPSAGDDAPAPTEPARPSSQGCG